MKIANAILGLLRRRGPFPVAARAWSASGDARAEATALAELHRLTAGGRCLGCPGLGEHGVECRDGEWARAALFALSDQTPPTGRPAAVDLVAG